MINNFALKKVIELRDFFHFALISVIGQGMGLLLPLLIAKLIDPREFASFSLALMVNLFFIALLISPTQAPFIIYSNEERLASGKINKTFSAQLIFFIGSLIIFSILSFLFKNQLAEFIGIRVNNLIYIFLAFVGLSLKTNIVTYFLAINKKKTSALFELIFNLFNILILFGLYILHVLDIETVFISYMLSALLLLVVYFFIIDRRSILPLHFEKEITLLFYHFTKWQVFGLSAAFFVNWGDNLALRIYSSFSDIATYNLAYQIFKGTITATYIIYSYFLTHISANINNPENISKYLNKKRPTLFFISLLLIGLSMIVLNKLIPLFYKNGYLQAPQILDILLIASIFATYTVFYIAIFNALKKYQFTQIVLIMQIVLNLGLDFLLVPHIGMYGAAIATVIGYVSVLIVYEWYFRRKIRPILNQ
ncbi:MAG: polysaccharide biosynthesis C-terminal domain-containing protein [Minisyncoccia bacterium]|jgi:O-antigen/teichoic acid export membrane protein